MVGSVVALGGSSVAVAGAAGVVVAAATAAAVATGGVGGDPAAKPGHKRVRSSAATTTPTISRPATSHSQARLAWRGGAATGVSDAAGTGSTVGDAGRGGRSGRRAGPTAEQRPAAQGPGQPATTESAPGKQYTTACRGDWDGR